MVGSAETELSNVRKNPENPLLKQLKFQIKPFGTQTHLTQKEYSEKFRNRSEP